MVLLICLVLLWTCPGSGSKLDTNIKCVVINLEYVNCTWDDEGLPQENCTFRSRYEGGPEAECQMYLKVNDLNVGCRFSYSEEKLNRFTLLHAWLYSANGSVVAEHHRNLINMVKLDPPYNLTVEMKNPELYLYWNSSNRTKAVCKTSQVRYKINHKNWQLQSESTERNSFSLPFPSTQSLYEFQVRVKMSDTCGKSEMWSAWSESVYCGSMKNVNDTDIKCVVINLEYVNCTWDDEGLPQENCTFRSRYEGGPEAECQTYLKVNDLNVGCRVSYSEEKLNRFTLLHAWLYSANGSVVAEHHRNLINMVKLDPPYNLTVEMKNPELYLYWNSSNRTKAVCKTSQVRYKINHKNWQLQSESTERNSFSLPFPSTQSLYEFQVRVKMSDTCGKSEMWSAWSESVYCGSMKNVNDTETHSGSSAALMILYTAGAAVVLVILSCLLVHSERLRVILVPVVPNPGKNFADLIDNYGGNVENWLSISKELQDGFKPNFTERTCPVREYRLVSQSSSDSDNSLSSLTDVSTDYQPMHSYSSASTLPAPAETTQTTPTAPSVL
uniref:Fibronectin type-III domain-containing protein n=1 Tax=Pygocentrus nattereri TaxID=42514 RepID=A0AAR2LCL6_PYGNA